MTRWLPFDKLALCCSKILLNRAYFASDSLKQRSWDSDRRYNKRQVWRYFEGNFWKGMARVWFMMCTGSEMFCCVVDDRAKEELIEKRVWWTSWSMIRKSRGFLWWDFKRIFSRIYWIYSRLKLHYIRTILKFVFVKQTDRNIFETCPIFDFF